MKRVIVTGGNKGIGLATSKKFLESGYEVIALGRDFKGFSLNSDRLQSVTFDLQNTKDIPSLVSSIGVVDILINNAGILQGFPFEDYPDDKKDEILKINLEAPIALMRAFIPAMIKKGGGRIVNTASIAGEIGTPDIWYGVTKAGLINVTKSLAKRFAKDGIVLFSVAPGPVETDMLKSVQSSRREELQRASYTGKFPKPEHIAEVIYWLATTAPLHMNGSCIDINDGAFPR